MLAYPDLIRTLTERLDSTFDANVLDEMESALQLAIDADDPTWACVAALAVSELLFDYGRLADALDWCDRVLAWIDRVDDFNVLPAAITVAVKVNFASDRTAVAMRLFSSALKRIRAVGDGEAEFTLIRNHAASVREYLGPERAHFWSRRAARKAAKDFGEKSARCFTFTLHAMILTELGRPRDALKWLDRAARLCNDEGVANPTRFDAHMAATSIHFSIGDTDQASLYRLEAASFSRDLDDRPLSQANALTTRADVLSHRDDFQGALKLLDQAVAYARKAHCPVQQIASLTSRIDVLSELNLFDRALADCRDGVRIASRSGSPIWQLNMLTKLAVLNCAVGRAHKLYACLAVADRIVNRVENPEVRASYAVIRLIVIEARQTPWELLVALRRLADAALSIVRVGIYPIGIGSLMNQWPAEVFSAALTHIQTALLPTDPNAWKYALYFLDARQCIAIREARRQQSLRMRPRNKPPKRRWRATEGPEITHFSQPPITDGSARDDRVRSINQQELSFEGLFREINDPTLFKPWSDRRSRNQPLVRPMTLGDCRELLPDGNTVLLVVTAHLDEVLFTPIRLNAAGEPAIIAPPTECCRRTETAERVQAWEGDCLDAERQQVDSLFRSHAGAAHSDLLRSHPWGSHFAELREELDLERVVRIIEPDPKFRQKLHLILIPDRYTCRLPFHAAIMEDGKRLYEHFATLRYAHSLSAIRYLSQIDRSRPRREARDRVLRGVAFASPYAAMSSGSGRWLDGVTAEVDALRAECGDSSWWVHGNVPGSINEATIQHFLERHNAGNILAAMGDGNMLDAIINNDGVRDIYCRMGTFRLTDGFLTHFHLQRWPFDFRPVQFAFFHACVIGRLMGARGYETEGFLASLASAGCRRVLSALWEISDEAAPHFTQCLMNALKRYAFAAEPRGPNSFAAAVRQAIDDFRALDDRKYDHDFFWAPYVLYGLG